MHEQFSAAIENQDVDAAVRQAPATHLLAAHRADRTALGINDVYEFHACFLSEITLQARNDKSAAVYRFAPRESNLNQKPRGARRFIVSRPHYRLVGKSSQQNRR